MEKEETVIKIVDLLTAMGNLRRDITRKILKQGLFKMSVVELDVLLGVLVIVGVKGAMHRD